MKPLNTVIGDCLLCTWQPSHGVTWVQTRSSLHARRLSQRRDGRLVMRGVVGGYLRTYEFRHSLRWAGRLISRYLRDETPTNAQENCFALGKAKLSALRGAGQRATRPQCVNKNPPFQP